MQCFTNCYLSHYVQQEGKDKVAALNLDIDATVTEHLTDFDR